MKSRYIAIEGNIGAGKTTLAKLMAENLDARLMLEQFVDNPFLPLFYAQPERYAFSLEMSFLADRYHQMGGYDKEDLFQPLLLADYSIYKSFIFAQNNLTGKEMELYRNFFNILTTQLHKPDLVVFLNRSYSTLRKHIVRRARSYEQQIPDEYLMNVQHNYIRFFKQNTTVPVLVINADQHDFVNNKAEIKVLQELIFQKFKPGLNFYDKPAEGL